MKGPLAAAAIWLGLLSVPVRSYRYDERYVGYNLNENVTATHPMDYYGKWEPHDFHKSPGNWRFPFYTLFIDKFVNGDPTNDNINGTLFEHDMMQTQLRHGGDLKGLIDSLDYIAGMGVRAIYIAGSPMVNAPWGADQYSPLDLTILDAHLGDMEMWRTAVQAIHDHGMYVVLDNTVATMGDLIAFDGYLNSSTPFNTKEYTVGWRNPVKQYHDFHFGNKYNETCHYPRFWLETGFAVKNDVTDLFKGCYDSDFDQFGDTEAFGVFPDWQRQLTKFASVQDRLREWIPAVNDKLSHFACMWITQLDIDGIRLDKATQITVDALSDFSTHVRACAVDVGKDNFFISGEITGGNTFGSIYLGRGRQPDMILTSKNATEAVMLNKNSSLNNFIRDPEKVALDAAAFHYSIYRSLTRFLGMDGNLAAGYDLPIDWVDAWNGMLLTNDQINPSTGVFDPRHMYGVTNQDVFRWPSLDLGTDRMLLGMFITTLLLPGIPLLLWGEEQNFYALDNTAANYVFGRQAMSSSFAWQLHGCYTVGSAQYRNFEPVIAEKGCEDSFNARDHRDTSSPVRNIIKSNLQMRINYPVLNDGYFLQTLSKQTHNMQLPKSNVPTEVGIWSILRSEYFRVQNLNTSSSGGQGNQPVWLLYHNDNKTINYEFDCSSDDTELTLIAPFPAGTVVKNLYAPYQEETLVASAITLGLAGETKANGCLPNYELAPYSFRAFVPKAKWVQNGPMMTKFVPGHDFRLTSAAAPGEQETIAIEFHYSHEMKCTDFRTKIEIFSRTEDGTTPTIDQGSVQCGVVPAEFPTDQSRSLTGAIPTTWKFKANLVNVSNGLHQLTLRNLTADAVSGGATNAVDKVFFRVGQQDNPVIFPEFANYTRALLTTNDKNELVLNHKAAGADQYRYSTNWASTWSDWMPYTGGSNTVTRLPWSGTDRQKWEGDHIEVQYFSSISGSSDYFQHGDLDKAQASRRLPHLFGHGPFNLYGYDNGIKNRFDHNKVSGFWEYNFMNEWPAVLQLNVWGINPDGRPDESFVFGDMDNDGVLDRMPPSSLTTTLINITKIPESPYLGFRITVNDGNYRYGLIPYGNQTHQMIMFSLFWVVPIITGALSIWLFMKSFYAVKFNKVGISESHGLVPLALRRALKRHDKGEKGELSGGASLPMMNAGHNNSNIGLNLDAGAKGRRTVLIATMEYDIEDWEIKIKIGGLGVMAQLMGKNLGHQDLIWVVPCVGGIDYPEDQRAEPMHVTILGISYVVEVQYHTLRNITYVLLDAPVFRAQSKAEPYPARMDDLDSAVYYSAWNQCIALAIERFPVDLYHINDYHGAVAPLHLLPQTIPVCLSLHNAEFQGLWPMRTNKEKKEVCAVYNLPEEVTLKYVQFGDVFNLLHAASSYLRIHQKGFGAVGVSAKYGKRSWARYPIFWGLSKIGKLPNPDPSDTGEWTGAQDKSEIIVNRETEASRGSLRMQAQQWAGLDQNPDADLLVFVGRWSMQKGVDLIADVMPAVLEENPNVQLICIGPVIDLYGKFAALKLDVLMQKYRGRVFSKPEFTALPPFIFSGAEFALIPSRDEPFGLVAVEFGRKGALGIGARVGGLGQMPGWWYTVESTTTTHLMHQFKAAIKDALSSKLATREMMRARSAKQRFPVVQWVNDLETLQTKAIEIHDKEALKGLGHSFGRDEKTKSFLKSNKSLFSTPNTSTVDVRSKMFSSPNVSSADLSDTRPSTPNTIEAPPTGLGRKLSLGYKSGPGHSVPRRRFQGNTLSVADSIADDGMSEIDEDEREYRRGGDDEYVVSAADLEAERIREQQARAHSPGPGLLTPTAPNFPFPDSPSASPRGRPLHQFGDEGLGAPSHLRQQHSPGLRSPSSAGSPGPDDILLPPSVFGGPPGHRASTLSLNSVVGDKTDFNLQKVDPFFQDTQGEYFRAFEKSLQNLDSKNSENQLCIEDYLMKSEKKWFDKFRDAKLGRGSIAPSKAGTPTIMSRRSSIDSFMNDGPNAPHPLQNSMMVQDGQPPDQFLLGNDYKPPTGLRLFMQYRIGTWPVYSFLLAFGQIIAANSYQITLLSGTVGQTASRLYVTASIYLVFSVVWWNVFILMKSIYVLSLPFVFYGGAFFLLGMAPFVSADHGREWIQNVATGFYAIAASSGSIFFALNFGDEGGAPIKDWAFRACMIQGTQQIYVVALWFWGDYLNRRQSDGRGPAAFNSDNILMTAVTVPVACLMWAVGIIIFTGMPNYYRQTPGKVPSFYKSLFRRKTILWFFVTVIIQNFFLSSLYGRNWAYLFASNHAATWQIILLIVFFFGFVWAFFLWFFGWLSKDHSWIIPIFAIGLGAPRWCQMLWSCTPMGTYIPWLKNPLASALASRALWLWLGTLDAIQGVGFGMLLLQTLTRFHVAFTLIAAQVIGSVVTMCARAFAPNNEGPGDVFPDFTTGIYPGITKVWFWVGLLAQLAICGGFFTFFRKEQLSKP